MIQSKNDLKEYLSYEVKQYRCSKGIKGALYYLAGNEKAVIWHFQKRMRITEYHLNTHHRLRYYLSLSRYQRLRNKHSLIIPLNTCGKGLKIMHLGPILMNGKARIGNDCALHINTAFVAKGTSDEAPTLGNGVVVGVGAIVLGGIHVADHVAIGANSVVNKDVLESNIAVAGIPARKISNNGRMEWNKKNKTENHPL